jgi:hypothetical protein
MSTIPSAGRLDYLDATRAFALILGIVFHASLSFVPFVIGWAVQDVSTGMAPAIFTVVSHSSRMTLFFLLAGLFGWMTCHRLGAARFLARDRLGGDVRDRGAHLRPLRARDDLGRVLNGRARPRAIFAARARAAPGAGV